VQKDDIYQREIARYVTHAPPHFVRLCLYVKMRMQGRLSPISNQNHRCPHAETIDVMNILAAFTDQGLKLLLARPKEIFLNGNDIHDQEGRKKSVRFLTFFN
jgi:hypothetical protein